MTIWKFLYVLYCYLLIIQLNLTNKKYNCVLLHTFTVNGIHVDKNYILNELQRRGITFVNGVKRRDGSWDQIHVENWLNRAFVGVERNYHWLLFYLTIVISMTFSERDQSRWWFRNISSSTLEGYISNRHGILTIIKNILAAARILKFNEKYAVGVFTKSVCLHPRFKLEKTSYKSLPEIDCSAISADKWLKDHTKEIECDLALSGTIRDNTTKIRLDVTVFKELEIGAYKSQKSEETNRQLVEDVYSFAGLRLKDSERLTENVLFRYHEHTGRVYQQLTSFPKAFRKHLSYKGAKLCVVDIRSAHAWMLLYWYRRSTASPTEIETEQDKYRSWFTDRQDRQDFYERLAAQGGIRKKKGQSDGDFRAEFKKKFFKFLYGKPHNPKSCLITKAYEREFPILLATLNWHKTNIYMQAGTPAYRHIERKLEIENCRSKKGQSRKTLKDFAYIQASLENQRLEGDVIIKGVCRDLAEQGIWFLPIHDAVACQQRRVRDVKRLMKQHWNQAIGYEPCLSVMDYSKSP